MMRAIAFAAVPILVALSGGTATMLGHIDTLPEQLGGPGTPRREWAFVALRNVVAALRRGVELVIVDNTR
jgi:hypothetical protein